MVEGWTLNKDGTASLIDARGNKAPIALDPKTTKSITVQLNFKVGLGLFDGKLITGTRGGSGRKHTGIVRYIPKRCSSGDHLAGGADHIYDYLHHGRGWNLDIHGLQCRN